MHVTNTSLRPWLYIVALFGSQLVVLAVVAAGWIVSPRFGQWVGTPVGTFSVTVFSALAALVTVILLSGSLRDPFSLFELQSLHYGIDFVALGAGVLLGVAGVFVTRFGLADVGNNFPLIKPFIEAPMSQKHLLAIVLLVAPIIEEIIMRGFLYRAFRDRYTIGPSVLTIVAVSMLTHPGVLRASPWLFLLLGVLQAMLCLIWEKTRNLWSCISCHLAYNVTVTTAWLMESS